MSEFGFVTSDMSAASAAASEAAGDARTAARVTRDEVEDWRDNFDDYQESQDGFDDYFNQPVEEDTPGVRRRLRRRPHGRRPRGPPGDGRMTTTPGSTPRPARDDRRPGHGVRRIARPGRPAPAPARRPSLPHLPARSSDAFARLVAPLQQRDPAATVEAILRADARRILQPHRPRCAGCGSRPAGRPHPRRPRASHRLGSRWRRSSPRVNWSRDRPWHVLRVSDQYDVLRAQGRASRTQRKVVHGGRSLDHHVCDDGSEAWFGIDLLDGREQ